MGGNAVRANWHLGDLELPSGDPLMIEDTAAAIDLSSGVVELHAELADAQQREHTYAKLFGVECSRKWKMEHRIMGGNRLSCFTCPHFREDEMDAATPVCGIGRQQETVITHIAALAEHGSLDEELAEAFERNFDAADELAEAMLAS